MKAFPDPFVFFLVFAMVLIGAILSSQNLDMNPCF